LVSLKISDLSGFRLGFALRGYWFRVRRALSVVATFRGARRAENWFRPYFQFRTCGWTTWFMSSDLCFMSHGAVLTARVALVASHKIHTLALKFI